VEDALVLARGPEGDTSPQRGPRRRRESPAPQSSPGAPRPPDPPPRAQGTLGTEKTFLQSLSEQERNALLRGARIFFQSGDSSDSSSLDGHLRRLDDLREVLDVDMGPREQGEGTGDTSPGASTSGSDGAPGARGPGAPRPGPRRAVEQPLTHSRALLEAEKEAVTEVARLRVQKAALEAENRALKSHSRRMAETVAQAKTRQGELLVENRQRQLQMARDSADTVSDLEEQLARHRTALAELAAQAEGLANDNALLATELAATRDQRALLEEHLGAVEERSRSVQSLYLNNLEETRRTVTAHEARRERILDQIATKEVLAASQPPGEEPLVGGGGGLTD